MRLFVIVPLLFASVLFASERIENGWTVPASNSVAQSVALLESDRGLCSATFLTQTFLLTAAHCTYRTTAQYMDVLVRDPSGTWHKTKAARLITHPNFQIQNTASGTKVRNDVALIQISAQFPFTIYPIKIGNITEYLQQEKQVYIYGYGRNSSSGTGSGTLRWGKMSAIVEVLELFYDRKGISMVPETNQALCGGDSGGPVMKIINSKRYIIGVNSLSNGCKNSPEVTSKAEIVYSQLPWLRQYVSGI